MTQQQLIDQIHTEFDTAQERLLKEAHQVLNDCSFDNLKSIADRQAALGFINTPTVKTVSEKNATKVKTKEEATAIEYYKQNYPFLKFLTEPELDRICKKYGLVYMPVENFIADIPEKNLSEIEKAQKLNECDKAETRIWCELKIDNSFSLTGGSGWYSVWDSEYYRIPKVLEGVHFDHWGEACRYLRTNMGFAKDYPVNGVKNFIDSRQGLYVCAPPSNFKGKNKNISFFVPEVKDPIVFRYVRGGVQVITKWGLEANDPALVVPVLN